MKKTMLIILFNLAVATGIYPQQLSIGFSTGVGTYSMSELKSLNEALQPDFDAKLVTDFPAWFYYKPSFRIRFEKLTLGLTYTYQSTGSRISAKDYSGEYRFDMKVHSNNPGIYLALDIYTQNKSRLSVYAEPGLSFSSLEINQYLYLLGSVINEHTISFEALNFYLLPGIDYSCSFFPSFTATVNLGYYIQAGKQDFHKDGDKDWELVNPVTHESIKPQWGGIRFGITLMYNIILKGHKSEAD
jgi:hypothetical protein